MTTVNPATSATSISTTNQPTSRAVMDMFLAQKMANIMNGIMQETSGISWKQLVGFLAMLSLEELRSILVDFIGFARNYFKTNAIYSLSDIYTFVKNTILYICRRVLNLFRTPPPLIEEPKIISTPSIPCEFTINNELVAKLINYALELQQLSYRVVEDSIKINTNTTYIYEKEELWTDIRFDLPPEITCYIYKELPINICKSKTNTILSIKYKNDCPVLVETDAYVLIPKQGFIELGKRLMLEEKTENGCYYRRNLFASNVDEKLVYPVFIDHGLKNIIHIDGRLYNIKGGIGECLTRLCLLYEKTHKQKMDNTAWQALTGSTSQFISFEHTYNQSKIDAEIEILFSKDGGRLKHQYILMVEQAKKGFHVEWKLVYTNKVEGEKSINHFTSQSVLGDYMSLDRLHTKIILVSNNLTNKVMREMFETFLLSMRNMPRKNDLITQQQTYYLALKRNEKTVETANPEYESWYEMCKMLNTSTDDKKTITVGSMPQKTIKNTIEEVSVYCKELGACMKPLETLYLAEADFNDLSSSLEMFRDKKTMLQSLGIPNKYGLFLSGPPGTGKTSTIYAVATYLQKPIYYVSLGNIKTNKELSMLFDYVNEKTIGGGIIVFEDIDCMTDIVCLRSMQLENSITTSVVDIVNEENDKLTLSYLLNIMDGVMSQDGMIVIASSNHPEKLDPAFLREGRFDIHIKLGYANKYQIKMIFKKFFERDISETVLSKIPEGKYTPAQFIFRFKNYVLRMGAKDEEIMQVFITE